MTRKPIDKIKLLKHACGCWTAAARTFVLTGGEFAAEQVETISIEKDDAVARLRRALTERSIPIADGVAIEEGVF